MKIDFTVLQVLADIIFLPETYAPIILTRKVSVWRTKLWSLLWPIFQAQKLRLETRRWELHSQRMSCLLIWCSLQPWLSPDETNDFTLRAFLETNLLRPVKMMFVHFTLRISPATDRLHRLFEPMVLCITLCVLSIYIIDLITWHSKRLQIQ